MQSVKNNAAPAGNGSFAVQLADKVRKDEHASSTSTQLTKIEFRAIAESYPVRKYSLDDNGGGYQGL